MKNSFNLFILLIVLTGCGNRQVSKTRIAAASAMVEIVPASDTLKLSEIFRSAECLELKGALIGEINDVKLVNDLIIVQSRVQDKDLHVFDREGNFIRSLIRYGRANDEVLNLQAFSYNEYLGTIDVLCNFGMDVKQYSLDGRDCRTITLPKNSVMSAKDIEILDDSSYVLYKDIGYTDSLEYKLYVYDYKKDSVTGSFIPLDRETEEKISFGQNNNLYRNDGKMFFYEVFQNGIFEIGREGIEPYVAFAENKYTFPSEDFLACKDIMDVINHCRESNYIWAHVNCIQCDRLIFSFFAYKSNVYCNVIDMERKEAHSYLCVKDDLLFNRLFPATDFNVIGADRGELICNFRNNDTLSDEQSYLLFLHN